jgi:signal peptidase
MVVLLIAGLLLGLLVVAPTATPFRVESATSDTMAPTIGSGDAYVTVPADTISEGDIAVFWAPGEGEFLTREVLDIGENGYVVGTNGGATGVNESATGDMGENATPGDPRVVPRSSIVATVATVAGSPVVLPELGGVVSTLATYRTLVLFSILLVLAALLVRRRLLARSSERVVMIRLRTVAVPLLAVIFVTCVAITPLSATSHQLTYSFDGTGGPGPADGENATRTAFLPTATPPLTQWTVSGETATVVNWTEEDGGINATLSVPPPEAASRTEVTVRMFPYPEWVPPTLLSTAHGVHPIVGSLLGAVILVVPLWLLYRIVLDPYWLVTRVRRRRLYLLWGS